MAKAMILLVMIFLLGDIKGKAQGYFVGDLVNTTAPAQLFQTKEVNSPKIAFVEKNFILTVSKSDLLHSLINDTAQLDLEFKNMCNTVIRYLNSSDKLMFKSIWAKSRMSDEISWQEARRLGARKLAKPILKECLCNLFDKGLFEIYEHGKKVDHYFSAQVGSEYGGYVRGIFSSNKRLIWICPPFTIQ